jgi:hypothetical protein
MGWATPPTPYGEEEVPKERPASGGGGMESRFIVSERIPERFQITPLYGSRSDYIYITPHNIFRKPPIWTVIIDRDPIIFRKAPTCRRRHAPLCRCRARPPGHLEARDGCCATDLHRRGMGQRWLL